MPFSPTLTSPVSQDTVSPKAPEQDDSKVPDGGFGWVIVFASFMISLLSDGFLYTIGEFHSEFLMYYHRTEMETAAVSSILTGFVFGVGKFY